jgi:hypothetical protein
MQAQAGPIPPGYDPNGQPEQHAVNLSSPSSGTNSGAQAAATATPANSDLDDDTLYRGSTKDSLGDAGARDEGPIHFKTRAKEKINRVDSLTNLQSSGTDPKFQGSFADSGVPSIENISNKGKQDSEASNGAEEQGNESGDPRFTKKRLTFVPLKKDDQKKTYSEDSSPSPSPSPTASAAAKDSGAPKK